MDEITKTGTTLCQSFETSLLRDCTCLPADHSSVPGASCDVGVVRVLPWPWAREGFRPPFGQHFGFNSCRLGGKLGLGCNTTFLGGIWGIYVSIFHLSTGQSAQWTVFSLEESPWLFLLPLEWEDVFSMLTAHFYLFEDKLDLFFCDYIWIQSFFYVLIRRWHAGYCPFTLGNSGIFWACSGHV